MTALSAALAFIWASAFWLLTRDRPHSVRLTIIGTWACVLGVVISLSVLWGALRAGYPTDSYWTLRAGGRAAVAAISTVGIAATFLGLSWKTSRILRRKRGSTATAWALIDIALGLLIFAVVFSVSPQVFYSLYRVIIPGLPQQWVIDGLLDQDRLKMIAVVAPGGSLADHLAGIALWATVPFTAWLHLRFWWRGGAARQI